MRSKGTHVNQAFQREASKGNRNLLCLRFCSWV